MAAPMAGDERLDVVKVRAALGEWRKRLAALDAGR